MFNNIASLIKIRVILFSFLLPVYWLVHLPILNEPPRSVHTWRQCNTSAVARNFSEESMKILKPRVDRRGASDGVTGMQFPLFEFIVACFAKIFGYSDSLPRVINLMIFSIGLWLSYSLFVLATNNKLLASVGVWSLAWSPELLYHSANALPDILALVLGIGSLVCFLRWQENKQYHFGLLSLIFIILAGLTKLQYLAFGCPMLVGIAQDVLKKKYKTSEIFLIVACGLCAVTIPISWYIHSIKLIEKSGLMDFGIRFNPISSLQEAKDVLTGNLFSDLPELLLNYAGFCLFLFGIFAFFRNKGWKLSWFPKLLLWTIILLTYHIIELGQMVHHGYYMMPYLIPLVFIIIYGAKYLSIRIKSLLLLFLILQPILGISRIYNRWVGKNNSVPIELYESETRKKLEGAVPSGSICIVGPDQSGCIYFYFLHKKGFGFTSATDLIEQKNGKPAIEEWISQGAQYLYTNDKSIPNHQMLGRYFNKIESQVGDFYVISLKSPSN